MGILGRYLYKEVLLTLFPIWAGLGFLLFILEYLAQVFRVHAPASTTALLYLFKIPGHLQLVFPMATLLSLIIVLGGMNKAREIVAVQAMGGSRRRLFLPCFLAVLSAGGVSYFITDQVAPRSMKKHFEIQDVEVDKVPSRFTRFRQEKIWYRNKDVLFNIGFFNPDKNEIYDVKIYTFDPEFNIAQILEAKQATWQDSFWVLSDGTLSLVDKRLVVPVFEKFETRTTRLIEAPTNLQRIEVGAETMTQAQLARAIERSRSLGVNTANWEVIYHARLSFLFVAVIFLVLAFPMTLKFNRVSSLAKDSVVVVGLCLVYWLIYSLSLNLGTSGKLHPIVAAWGPSWLAFIAVYLFVRTQDLRALLR